MLRMTVGHMSGETAPSLVSRLAARNGVPFAASFCQDYRLSLQGVVDGEPAAIQRLAGLAGVDPDILFASTFRKTERTVLVLGTERFMSQWMSRTRLRVCPACLLQDAAGSELPPDAAMYGRTCWQVSFVRTCPVHERPLVDLPSERKTVHDFAASVRRHAAHLPGLAEASETMKATGLERYLVRRIAGVPGNVPLLDDVQAGLAARFCEVLGTVRVHGRTQRPGKLDDAGLRSAGEAGFELAAEGEEAVRTFVLDLMRGDTSSRSANGGAQSALGTLHAWFSDNRRSRDQDGLRGLVRDVVAAHLPIGTDALCLGERIGERRLHSIRSASLETGLHPKRLRKLLWEGGFIDDDHVARPDNLVTFPADTSASFLARLTGTMGLAKVSARINAPRVQAQLLFRAGHLLPVHPRAGSPKRLLAFDPVEVDGLMTSLLRDAEALPNEMDGVFSIPRAAKRVPCGAMDIVRLIRERRLPWVGRRSDERGFMSIRVRPDQVRSILFPGIGISVRQAAVRLGIPVGITRRLLGAGLLRACDGQGIKYKHERYTVDPTSIDEFRSQFIGLSDLVPAWGSTPRLARVNLIASGHHPVASSYEVARSYYRIEEIIGKSSH